MSPITKNPDVAHDRRYLLVPIGVLFICALGAVAVAFGRDALRDPGPVYTVAEVRAGLLSDPHNWVGRIVRVCGLAWFSAWMTSATSWEEYPCAPSGWTTCSLTPPPLTKPGAAGHLGIADAPFPGLPIGTPFSPYWARLQQQGQVLALGLPRTPPPEANPLLTMMWYLPVVGPLIPHPVPAPTEVRVDRALAYRVRLLPVRQAARVGAPPPCDDAILLGVTDAPR